MINPDKEKTNPGDKTKKGARSCVLPFKNGEFFFLKYQKTVNFLAIFLIYKIVGKKQIE